MLGENYPNTETLSALFPELITPNSAGVCHYYNCIAPNSKLSGQCALTTQSKYPHWDPKIFHLSCYRKLTALASPPVTCFLKDIQRIITARAPACMRAAQPRYYVEDSESEESVSASLSGPCVTPSSAGSHLICEEDLSSLFAESEEGPSLSQKRKLPAEFDPVSAPPSPYSPTTFKAPCERSFNHNYSREEPYSREECEEELSTFLAEEAGPSFTEPQRERLSLPTNWKPGDPYLVH